MQGSGFDGAKLVDPPNNLPEFLGLPTACLAWVSEVENEPYAANTLGVIQIFFHIYQVFLKIDFSIVFHRKSRKIIN